MGEIQVSDTVGRRRRGGPVRFVLLVVVPTSLAFEAWRVPWVRHGRDGLLIPGLLAIAGILPLIGLLVAVLYIWSTRDWLQLRPFWPFAAVAAVFAVSMVDLALTIPRDPSQNAIIPVVEVSSGFLQAWLALGGGLVSFFAGRRERPRR